MDRQSVKVHGFRRDSIWLQEVLKPVNHITCGGVGNFLIDFFTQWETYVKCKFKKEGKI